MAIRTVNPDRVAEYVCLADRESDTPTTFVLGSLTGRMRQTISDATATLGLDGKDVSPEAGFRYGTRMRLTVKYGLRGWRNLLDHSGQPIAELFEQVPFGGRSVRVVADHVLDLLPDSVLIELCGEIMKLNELQEEDRRPLASRSG